MRSVFFVHFEMLNFTEKNSEKLVCDGSSFEEIFRNLNDALNVIMYAGGAENMPSIGSACQSQQDGTIIALAAGKLKR